MSNESYLGTTIDNPPPAAEEYQSNIGKAVSRLREGRRLPADLAASLMEEGFDVPGLTAHYAQGGA